MDPIDEKDLVACLFCSFVSPSVALCNLNAPFSILDILPII